MRAFREKAHFRQIGEGDVTVIVQDGGEVGQVQGEGEERASMALALLKPLLACREQQHLFIQQGSFAVGEGLTVQLPAAALGWTD